MQDLLDAPVQTWPRRLLLRGRGRARLALRAGLLLPLLLLACGEGPGTGPDGATPSGQVTPSPARAERPEPPTPPTLGVQAQALGEPNQGYPSDQERMVLVLTNLARTSAQTPNGNDCGEWTSWLAQKGITLPKRPLTYAEVANRAARFTSKHLSDQGCFQHESCCVLGNVGGAVACTGAASCSASACDKSCSGGTSTSGRYQLLGYTDWSGENIAKGQGSAYAAWCAWMHSEGHRENIYANHTELGVGAYLAQGATCSGWFWTQAFGQSAAPVPRIPAASAVHAPPQPPSAADVHFAANYYDASGKAPQRAMVVVGGHCLDLERAWGVDSNGTYEVRFSDPDALPPGCHPYYFLFVDGDADRHTYPTEGSFRLALGGGQSCPDGYDAAPQAPADCETGVQTCTAGARESCYAGPAGTLGVGECREGHVVCKNGFWSACREAQVPRAEVCDGLDNDCDGQVDEGLAQGTASCVLDSERGECRAGLERCLGGDLVCEPVKTPEAETCDGLDNDCDGVADDGFGIQTCGQGECFRVAQSCDGAPVTCTPGTPTDELLDFKDNDCNGLVDDGFACTAGAARPCYSRSLLLADGGSYQLAQPCRAGVQSCQADAGWGPCVGEQGPTAEACDGLDNDCNGVADDADAVGWQRCGVGECLAFGSSCVSGAPKSCAPKAPTPERCDGKDNDCDAEVDEGCACRDSEVARPCYTGSPAWTKGIGPCREGARTCTGGAFTACVDEVVPGAELCNGVDDDCDGTVDEDCVEPGPDAGTPDAGDGEGPGDGEGEGPGGDGGEDDGAGGCGCGAGGEGVASAALGLWALWLARRRGPRRVGVS